MIMTLVHEVVAIDHTVEQLPVTLKTVGNQVLSTTKQNCWVLRYREVFGASHRENVRVFDFDLYRNLTLQLHN